MSLGSTSTVQIHAIKDGTAHIRRFEYQELTFLETITQTAQKVFCRQLAILRFEALSDFVFTIGKATMNQFRIFFHYGFSLFSGLVADSYVVKTLCEQVAARSLSILKPAFQAASACFSPTRLLTSFLGILVGNLLTSRQTQNRKAYIHLSLAICHFVASVFEEIEAPSESYKRQGIFDEVTLAFSMACTAIFQTLISSTAFDPVTESKKPPKIQYLSCPAHLLHGIV